jgi:hypothetical protein
MVAAGSAGTGGSTGGPCGSIPARGTWDAASISPVAAPAGEPGYQFKGKSVSVVVDPFDTAKVWLGTGEYGLYQSTDGGANWKHVSTGTNGGQIDKSTLWSMAVDPVNKGTIYTVAAYGAGSVWKSTNGGVDWADLFGTFLHTPPRERRPRACWARCRRNAFGRRPPSCPRDPSRRRRA